MGRIVVEDLVPALLESRKDVYVGKRCFVPNGKCGQKKKKNLKRSFSGNFTISCGLLPLALALPCSLTCILTTEI